MPHGQTFVATSSSARLLAYLFLLSGRSRSPGGHRSFGFFRLLLFYPMLHYQLWLATSFLAFYLLYIAISTFTRLFLYNVGTFLVLLLILYYSSYWSILLVVHFQLLSSALFPVVLRTSRSLPVLILHTLTLVRSHSS